MAEAIAVGQAFAHLLRRRGAERLEEWLKPAVCYWHSFNWPGAAKAVSEWFPKRERGLAAALFDSGSSVGGIIAPFVIVPIYYRWGWQPAFVVPGLLGNRGGWTRRAALARDQACSVSPRTYCRRAGRSQRQGLRR